MIRNLDITALRSFVAVADTGGVTRAAGYLNLTQSAVSMQLKRLEEFLGLELLDRTGRGIALTASGDQLLGYARRLVALNDEAIGRLTHQAFEGEIVLGVPHDIVYPAIPLVLRRFNAMHPRVKVNLISAYTKQLKQEYARGACDLILATEITGGPGAETLTELPLIWIGAPNGSEWRKRPLRLAFGRNCLFRPKVLAALDAADIPWDMAVDADSDRTIEATVSADLAVHAVLEGTEARHLERIDHGGDLPDLPVHQINLYGADHARRGIVIELAELLRQSYRRVTGDRLRAVP